MGASPQTPIMILASHQPVFQIIIHKLAIQDIILGACHIFSFQIK